MLILRTLLAFVLAARRLALVLVRQIGVQFVLLGFVGRVPNRWLWCSFAHNAY